MSPEQHLAKGARVMAGMAKFRMPDDYLALIDASLIAGYHYGNALLHRAGVLPESEHANTPSKLEAMARSIPASIQPAFAAFAGLEKLRTDFVRSPSDYDSGLAQRVVELLDIMRRAAESRSL
jgi:hypothetical protein